MNYKKVILSKQTQGFILGRIRQILNTEYFLVQDLPHCEDNKFIPNHYKHYVDKDCIFKKNPCNLVLLEKMDCFYEEFDPSISIYLGFPVSEDSRFADTSDIMKDDPNPDIEISYGDVVYLHHDEILIANKMGNRIQDVSQIKVLSRTVNTYHEKWFQDASNREDYDPKEMRDWLKRKFPTLIS